MQLFVQLEGIRLGPNGFDLRQVPNGKVAVIIELSKVKLDRESSLPFGHGIHGLFHRLEGGDLPPLGHVIADKIQALEEFLELKVVMW